MAQITSRVIELEEWRKKHEDNHDNITGRVIVLEECAKSTDRRVTENEGQVASLNKCVSDQQKLIYEQWSRFQWFLIATLGTSVASLAIIIIKG